MTAAIFAGAMSLGHAQTYMVGETAVPDPSVSNSLGFHSLFLPGLGTDFVFRAGGNFTFDATGDNAVLTGVAYRVNKPDDVIIVNFRFGGRVNPGDPGFPDPATLHYELIPSAYMANGGPVDPAQWSFFETMTGEFFGQEALYGFRATTVRTGSPMQLGFGANGKNTNFGLSGWINSTVTSQPVVGPPITLGAGDLNIDLDSGNGHCGYAFDVNSHALDLATIGDFIFLNNSGSFVENADGTAVISGCLANINQMDQRFDLLVTMGGRVDPLDVNYPPAGSPHRELPAFYYVENGGVIDTNTWSYYTTMTGSLTGKGQTAGALIDIGLLGHAPQAGVGANGRNTEYGFSAWFTLNIVSQPTTGPMIPHANRGDFNINLRYDCPPVTLTLTNPGTVPTVETISNSEITLAGANLRGVDHVEFGAMAITDALPTTAFGNGFFTVMSDSSIAICPPQCLPAGTYDVRVVNGSGTSQTIQVQLTEPVAPKLVTCPEVAVGETQSVFMHTGGTAGTPMAFPILSSELSPSVFPGLVSLDIGNQFSSYIVGPAMLFGSTGCADFSFQIPASLGGTTMHFQAIYLDLNGATAPLPVTNYSSTNY